MLNSLPPELVPLPLPEDLAPSYFPLGSDFMPPPPLPLDESREVPRPPPLGRLSPNNSYSDEEDDEDDRSLSPIRGRRPRHHYGGEALSSDDSGSRRSGHFRGGRKRSLRDQFSSSSNNNNGGPRQTSSPIIPHGFNLWKLPNRNHKKSDMICKYLLEYVWRSRY